MPPRVIAVVGPIRSGKSTISKYIASKYGYSLASNSGVLKQIASKLDIRADRANLKRIGDAIFSTLGNDTLARFRLEQDRFPIVVDGVRYAEEIVAYRREPTFRLLGVAASDDVRYERTIALAHEGKDTSLSRQAFAELALARSEAEVDALLLRADQVISNNSSISQLEIVVDGLMQAWSSGS